MDDALARFAGIRSSFNSCCFNFQVVVCQQEMTETYTRVKPSFIVFELGSFPKRT